MARILFVYPNIEGYPVIPLAFSLFSGILKKEGHEIGLFDITFMVENLDHKARESIKSVKTIDNIGTYWGKRSGFNINEELKKKLQSFNPDLVGFTIVENNYGCARDLFKVVKAVKDVPILVGGMFPTVAPKFFIEDDNVDLICFGEGEFAITEIARRIDSGKDFLNIPNIITKLTNRTCKTVSDPRLLPMHQEKTSMGPVSPYYRWEPNVIQDWTIFDPRHLHKPFMGRMHKTGYFETARGCLFKCAYCNNVRMQQLYKAWGIEENYNRDKPMPYVMEEISCLKKEYSLELVFFNDENFLQIPHRRLVEFCITYKREIDLPFFIQTTAQTLQMEEKVRLLKEAGCITIGVGVEHGNFKLRSKILNKITPDSIIVNAIANCNKYGIRSTAFIMLGIPGETEETIMESVEFCKKIKAPSVSLAIFAPYHGTSLRDLCIRKGYIEDRYYENIGINFHSVLNMPQLSSEKLEELYYKFVDMVYGDSTESNRGLIAP